MRKAPREQPLSLVSELTLTGAESDTATFYLAAFAAETGAQCADPPHPGVASALCVPWRFALRQLLGHAILSMQPQRSRRPRRGPCQLEDRTRLEGRLLLWKAQAAANPLRGREDGRGQSGPASRPVGPLATGAPRVTSPRQAHPCAVPLQCRLPSSAAKPSNWAHSSQKKLFVRFSEAACPRDRPLCPAAERTGAPT